MLSKMKTLSLLVSHNMKTRHEVLADSVIRWFLERENMFSIKIHRHIIKEDQIDFKYMSDCWGIAEKVNSQEYMIVVSEEQEDRDFCATLLHELIHVRQWVRGSWEGDGETEAEQEQYELADLYEQEYIKDLEGK